MEKLSIEEVVLLTKPVNPVFSSILDDIQDNNYPNIYLAEYNYGDVLANDKTFKYPIKETLCDYINLPKIIKKDFSEFGINIPFGILINKSLEYFVDTGEKTIPGRIYHPGECFGYEGKLHDKKIRYSLPMYYLNAGGRSCFSITNLGNSVLFSKIKGRLKKNVYPPKSLYSHQPLFKELYSTFTNKDSWKLKVLYFSDNWIKKIKTNKKYIYLKLFLLDEYRNKVEVYRIRESYNYLTSKILLEQKSFKPEPFVIAIIRTFLYLLINSCIGYNPLQDDKFMPLSTIRKILIDEYQIPNSPIIFGPDFLKGNNIIYYSLNYMSSFIFSKLYSTVNSTVNLMHDIDRFANFFFKEFSKLEEVKNNEIYHLIKNLSLSYFHTHTSNSEIIQLPYALEKFDKRIANKKDTLSLPHVSNFVRGLIGIKTHE